MAEKAIVARSHLGWVKLTAGAGVAAILVFLYQAPLRWAAAYWFESTWANPEVGYWGHGPIVVLISAYLLWRQRRLLFRPSPWGWGGIGVAAGLALYGLASAWGMPYLSLYSLIVLAMGLVALGFGGRAAWACLFPLLFLIVAVPFPVTEWGITGFLAGVVARLSAGLAGAVGVPVIRQDKVIFVGGEEYFFEPLCSGFNYLTALYALVLPLLYLRGAPWKQWLGLFLAIPLLGLGAKVLLVTTTLVLTPVAGSELALALYHRWLPIPVFLLALAGAVVITGNPLIPRRSPPASP